MKYQFPDEWNHAIPKNPGYPLLVAIAQTLDMAGIPNLAFGLLPRAILGTDEYGPDSQVIVPDHLMSSAISALNDKGLPTCEYGDTCPVIRGRPLAVPHAHFHLNPGRVEITLDLFKHSDLIWSLPRLRLATPPADDANYTLAGKPTHADPKFYRGPLPETAHPVKILTKSATVNALVMLCCRDYGTPCEEAWMVALKAMKLEMLDSKELGAVDPRFVPFYKSVHDIGSQTTESLLKQLPRELKGENELGARLAGAQADRPTELTRRATWAGLVRRVSSRKGQE